MDDGHCDVSFRVYLRGDIEEGEDDVEISMIQLRRDWSELGTVAAVPADSVPDDARVVDAALVGGIIAAIPPELLVAVIDGVFRWINGRPGRTVRVERADGASLELSRATAEEQRAIVADWLRQGSAT